MKTDFPYLTPYLDVRLSKLREYVWKARTNPTYTISMSTFSLYVDLASGI